MANPATVSLRSYRVRAQGRCPPILNLLIIGSSLGLFAYVNTYFVVELADVMDGTVYSKTTETFGCEGYYCDQTAYNFIYYYSNYLKCNQRNCLNVICDAYNCLDSQNYDINYYYACQPGCPGALQDQPVPYSLYTAYILSIVAACFFGLAFLINALYGIAACFCYGGLNPLEKAGLLLGFVWPRLKYFGFRKREYWEDFELSFKPLVGMENAVNVCYAVTLGVYIALEVMGFWQTPPEIANFYLLILAYIARVSMAAEVSAPFCRADNELYDLRNNNSYI